MLKRRILSNLLMSFCAFAALMLYATFGLHVSGGFFVRCAAFYLVLIAPIACAIGWVEFRLKDQDWRQ